MAIPPRQRGRVEGLGGGASLWPGDEYRYPREVRLVRQFRAGERPAGSVMDNISWRRRQSATSTSAGGTGRPARPARAPRSADTGRPEFHSVPASTTGRTMSVSVRDADGQDRVPLEILEIEREVRVLGLEIRFQHRAVGTIAHGRVTSGRERE